MTDDLVARARAAQRDGHRIETLTARAEAAEGKLDAVTAERDALIRDRNRWAEEAQVNTSPIIAGLIAENAPLRKALKPFANYAKSLKGWEPTEAVCSEIGLDFERVVTAGDFITARDTLKGQQP
jgi:hypothetical protein